MNKLKHIFIALALMHVSVASAQNEDAIWTMGRNTLFDFSTAPPAQGTPPMSPAEYSAAVCFPNGAIRFWVNLLSHQSNMLFSANGSPIANSNLASDHGDPGNGRNYARPIIIQRPGSSSQFYIIHCNGRALFYTLLDMAANGGNGAVVQKDIMLSGYSTIVPARIVALRGCDAIWLVARSLTNNTYKSFRITSGGISNVPVISEIGLMASYYGEYEYGSSATIKAARDGSKIATVGGWGTALELYDFERCSGKLVNARLIDSNMSNPHPTSSAERILYTGLCFSANSSKLYAIKTYPYAEDSVSNGYFYGGHHGRVFQFDLSLPTTAAVISSRTMVLDNPYILYSSLSGCNTLSAQALRDLKMGIDGKIYIHNNLNLSSCDPTRFPSYSTGPAFHVINSPDNAGLSCNPITNAFSTGFFDRREMPNEIVTSTIPKTLGGGTATKVVACFMDSLSLKVRPDATCVKWFDGIEAQGRNIYSSGKYWVSYNLGCSHFVDTFKATFIRLPTLVDGNYACPSANNGKAIVVNAPGDTTTFNYTWISANGRMIQSKNSNKGDTVVTLDTGISTLRVSTTVGCDTLLSVNVRSLQKPVSSFISEQPLCVNMPITFLSTSTAPLVNWLYRDSLYISKKLVLSFSKKGSYPLSLIARNIEGCADTATSSIEVTELNLSLNASDEIIGIGEEVRLDATADQPFHVITWMPANMFNDHGHHSQKVGLDTITRFSVIGRSEMGCLDTAYKIVAVRPKIFVPNAFSPNNDGRNDRFRVVSVGSKVRVKRMEIFNRWGNNVFRAFGPEAEKGWDGTQNNRLCETGTYFFTVVLETIEGKSFFEKGDFILLR